LWGHYLVATVPASIIIVSERLSNKGAVILMTIVTTVINCVYYVTGGVLD
jgi:hypothetical protein